MKLYGILGYPLIHSYSPDYFNRMFLEQNIDAQYLKFETETIDDIVKIINEHPSLIGFNITIPHKQHIIPFLDNLSTEAKEIGAVNCVKISYHTGKPYLTGYNTDALGFKRALCHFIPPTIKKALILGNGGAAKAVRYSLQQLGIESLTVSRNPEKEGLIGYSDVSDYLSDHHLIINTTPLGTFPDIQNSADIPYHQLTNDHYLFDLVYNPSCTAFMQKGKLAGAHTSNGLIMWQEQAKYSWEIWNQDN